MTHVLYKGSAHALIDLLSGLEPVMFAHTSTALHLIRNFKLVALTTMGIERSAIAPDLCTVSELAFKVLTPESDLALLHRQEVLSSHSKPLVLTFRNSSVRSKLLINS